MSNNTIIKKSIPHIIACLLFLALNAIYFSAQLQGKVEKAGDIVAARANLQEIIKYEKETGKRTKWTNSLFSGMPTYQIDGGQPNNLTKHLHETSHLFIGRPIGMFFASMLVFYIMLVLIGVNPWLSIVGALAFGLTTNNYVLYSAGHMSKIYSIIYFGLLTAGVVLAFKKKYLLGAIIFALGFALNLYSNHIQMTYYFGLTLIIYGIAEFISHYKKADLASYGKSVLYLVLAGVIAVGSSAGKLLTSYEYGQETMRGAPILAAEAGRQKTSSETDGLEYNYATKWSNGYMDLVAGFIPGVVGGGGGNYWGANTDGTAGPAYYGAIVFFLFILGLLVVQGPVKWWLLIGVLLISFISLGKNHWLHGILFDYLPMFNKFRTPNSALTVVTFMVPILGILAVNDIIKGKVDKQWLLRSLYVSTGVMAVFCLFFALAGPSFFDFNSVYDPMFQQQGGEAAVARIRADRASMMSSDSWRSLGFILVAAALIWLFVKEKINQTILIAGLGLFIVFDLWTVNRDYLNNDKFVQSRIYKASYTKRPVDDKILADKDPHYRVFDISQGFSAAINSSEVTNKTSYYHKNIGGYHPAKLQRYQDMLDRHIGPEVNRLIQSFQNARSQGDLDGALANLKVMNMLNMKYLIYNNESPLPNRNALGNAWFADNYQVVNNANEEIDRINTINPVETAVVHQEFSDYLSGMNIQKNGSIQLTDYKPDHITYSSNSTSDQLAVFSEVWYGPDKGWNAYIDGNPADHIRANYVLRALKVPSGEHTIEFKFEPRSFAIGSVLSFICSLLIILGLLGYIGWYFKKEREKEEVAVKTRTTTENKSKERLKPTKSKGKKRKKK